MQNFQLLVSTSLILAIGFGGAAQAQIQAQSQNQTVGVHQAQIVRLNFLLSIDRLSFYSEGLADYLEGHGKVEIAEGIRQLKMSDFESAKLSKEDLNNNQNWNLIILNLLKAKSASQNFTQSLKQSTANGAAQGNSVGTSQITGNSVGENTGKNSVFAQLQLEDLRWDYNFFRNKLIEDFKFEPLNLDMSYFAPALSNSKPVFSRRSIPRKNGNEVLLDAERYISEKTTRAVFVDAALTNKSLEFHFGTERDFRQRVFLEHRVVLGEVRTRAANYNKIYFVYDPATNDYSYAFTRISGDDRVKHLISQMSLLNLRYQDSAKNSFAKVYGNAHETHLAQKERLLELFKTLPEADLVIIGQKAALLKVISTAGQMAQIRPDIQGIAEDPKNAIEKLSRKVKKSNSYFAAIQQGSLVDKEHKRLSAPGEEFELAQSEQSSHEFSDVLFETQEGRTVRWRFISNMWGDEVIPVAQALRESGHEKVVYIGTAGALIQKGLEVGDVVAPARTYNQKGELMELEDPIYGVDFIHRGMILGQVVSPFDETKTWFKKWRDRIDLVELETGYLKENLGPHVSFQPYLLISDIVGSLNETLAVAGAHSSKRKNGQLKLLESIFLTNKIKRPVPWAAPNKRTPITVMFDKIDSLRPSRDVVSKLQLAQLALMKGISSEAELLKLIKSEPAFDRKLLYSKLEKFSEALHFISNKIPYLVFGIAGPEDILNGTWNPKKAPLKIQLFIGELKPLEAQKIFEKELSKIRTELGKDLNIELVSRGTANSLQPLIFESGSKGILTRYYENSIFSKVGLNKEIDGNGGIRLREIEEAIGGWRCEAVLL